MEVAPIWIIDVSLRLVHQLRRSRRSCYLVLMNAVADGRLTRRRHERSDADAEASQLLPVFQTGSWCESGGDSNQRVMVIFCWV